MLRRLFVAAAALALIAAAPQAAPFKPGDVLPAWTSGTLDIHQIATGRGNAGFMIFPDGTSVLIDAGDQGETEYADQRPDSSRTPGQWIARYVRHMLGQINPSTPARLDYAVLTHFHPDHMGNAGWLTERWGVRLWCTQGEYLSARLACRQAGPEDFAPRLEH